MEKIVGRTYEYQLGPEHAGELVAWVAVEENESFFLPTVSMATVGNKGVYYRSQSGGPGPEYRGFKTDGFCVPVVGCIAVNKESHHIESLQTRPHRTSDKEIFSSTVVYQEPFIISKKSRSRPQDGSDSEYSGVETEGTWHVGAEAIVTGLHAALQKHDIDYAYPSLYFYLNYYSNPNNFLVDTAMLGSAYDERVAVQSICTSLQQSWDIANSLNAALLDTRVRNLPEHTPGFLDARAKIAANEQHIRETQVKNHIFAQSVYPVGFRRPMYDADFATEFDEKNYHREVASLRALDYKSVGQQLEKEVDELKQREKFAQTLSVKSNRLWGQILFANKENS